MTFSAPSCVAVADVSVVVVVVLVAAAAVAIAGLVSVSLSMHPRLPPALLCVCEHEGRVATSVVGCIHG